MMMGKDFSYPVAMQYSLKASAKICLRVHLFLRILKNLFEISRRSNSRCARAHEEGFGDCQECRSSPNLYLLSKVMRLRKMEMRKKAKTQPSSSRTVGITTQE